MKLSELISQVGDENIAIQTLETSFVRGSVKKHDVEITFATNKTKGQNLITAVATGGKADELGLIVWIPREKLPERLR